ncbi:MAG: hypothetical protein NUV69_00590 [Candidatus Curtissbacteria bacterium]|nr:hypothetical protein [Candidatus Curtissbacteria bacterium]
MVRTAHYLREDQLKSLKELPGNESEHIRRAIDKYIQDLKAKDVSASASVRDENDG